MSSVCFRAADPRGANRAHIAPSDLRSNDAERPTFTHCRGWQWQRGGPEVSGASGRSGDSVSDYEHVIRGADGYRPPSKEPAESDFLRSSVEMDRCEGDGDEFVTARSQSFDEPAPEMGNYRTAALQTGASGAFHIDAFRRQMGFVPPPRPAALPKTQAPRAPAALIDDSSIDSDRSSLHTLSTRTMSGGNPRYDPIAPLNRGPPPPKKRGFFQKRWSKIRGRGWR